MMAAKCAPEISFDTRALRGSFKLNEPMSGHTSWRVGGAAEYFYLPADRQDIVNLLTILPSEIPVNWIGLGSNMLVRDGGIEGVVIKTIKALGVIKRCPGDQMYSEAGVSCAKVARKCVAENLSGAEFLAGVPGSFGGALAMNAGAFGGETWPLVRLIDCVDRQGHVKTFDAAGIHYGYRHVDLPQGFALLGALIQLSAAESVEIGRIQIKELLEKRSASQPIQSANAGSVFKNPPGNFAAKIIEQLGLKGVSRGGARFSEVHANFIINDGTATAWDIEQLISLAQEGAREKLDIKLETEVRILGRSL